MGIIGFTIILFFLLAGDIISSLTGHFIPGSVIGMVLLFAALCMKIIRPEWIRSASDFLTKNMTVMFIPAAIGIVEQWGLIKTNLIPWIVIVFAGWLMVLAASGWAVQIVSQKKRK